MNNTELAVMDSITLDGSSSYPPAPPEFQSAMALNPNHMPMAFKHSHQQIREAINRIPTRDDTGMHLRDAFLTLIQEPQQDGLMEHQLSLMLGESSARQDLLERRISEMTPADFIIVDPRISTPDHRSLVEVRDMLLKDDRERFAKVRPGVTTSEWEVMDDGPTPH